MLLDRDIEPELLEAIEQYPVVTITGPRQSGKTTLCKKVFKDYNYCNLEHPEIKHLADSDPNAFFRQYPSPLIIDEIQKAPDLLSYIQVQVDESKKTGQFVLTGSHQFQMQQAITQSLAGRTALLYLLPFSIHELTKAGIILDRDDYMFKGFLPRVFDHNLNPTKAYRYYYQTYVERDLRQLVNIRNLTGFDNFMRLLAGRVGQVLNVSSLSNDLGISNTTLSEWLSILEASYIIFRLPPYFQNFGKRVIKSPKLYFVDVGLAAYLLGIESNNQIARDPLMGNLFENLVVLEALKSRYNKGQDSNLYFFRDNNKNEVDLVLRKGGTLYPFEIKAGMTYNDNMLHGIKYFQKLTPGFGYLIYAGELTYKKNDIEIINFKNTSAVINDL